MLGVLVIVMGVVFMGGFGWLQRDAKIHAKPPAGLWGAPLLGITFGLGWAPCIGPDLLRRAAPEPLRRILGGQGRVPGVRVQPGAGHSRSC